MLVLNSHDEALANLKEMNKKLEITKIQMVGTLNELEEIGELNSNWASSMASLLEDL
jgi:cell division protein ZapA (FtsZ GTPase activity inhibitor)